jgi:hypothetical protein
MHDVDRRAGTPLGGSCRRCILLAAPAAAVELDEDRRHGARWLVGRRHGRLDGEAIAAAVSACRAMAAHDRLRRAAQTTRGRW